MEVGPSVDALALEVEGAILVREQYVTQLQKYLTSVANTLNSNDVHDVSDLLLLIRSSSLIVIQAILDWRMSQANKPLAYLYGGQKKNYLLKMCSDTNFVQKCKSLRKWLRISFIRNPFILESTLDDLLHTKYGFKKELETETSLSLLKAEKHNNENENEEMEKKNRSLTTLQGAQKRRISSSSALGSLGISLHARRKNTIYQPGIAEEEEMTTVEGEEESSSDVTFPLTSILPDSSSQDRLLYEDAMIVLLQEEGLHGRFLTSEMMDLLAPSNEVLRQINDTKKEPRSIDAGSKKGSVINIRSGSMINTRKKNLRTHSIFEQLNQVQDELVKNRNRLTVLQRQQKKKQNAMEELCSQADWIRRSKENDRTSHSRFWQYCEILRESALDRIRVYLETLNTKLEVEKEEHRQLISENLSMKQQELELSYEKKKNVLTHAERKAQREADEDRKIEKSKKEKVRALEKARAASVLASKQAEKLKAEAEEKKVKEQRERRLKRVREISTAEGLTLEQERREEYEKAKADLCTQQRLLELKREENLKNFRSKVTEEKLLHQQAKDRLREENAAMHHEDVLSQQVRMHWDVYRQKVMASQKRDTLQGKPIYQLSQTFHAQLFSISVYKLEPRGYQLATYRFEAFEAVEFKLYTYDISMLKYKEWGYPATLAGFQLFVQSMTLEYNRKTRRFQLHWIERACPVRLRNLSRHRFHSNHAGLDEENQSDNDDESLKVIYKGGLRFDRQAYLLQSFITQDGSATMKTIVVNVVQNLIEEVHFNFVSMIQRQLCLVLLQRESHQSEEEALEVALVWRHDFSSMTLQSHQSKVFRPVISQERQIHSRMYNVGVSVNQRGKISITVVDVETNEFIASRLYPTTELNPFQDSLQKEDFVKLVECVELVADKSRGGSAHLGNQRLILQVSSHWVKYLHSKVSITTLSKIGVSFQNRHALFKLRCIQNKRTFQVSFLAELFVLENSTRYAKLISFAAWVQCGAFLAAILGRSHASSPSCEACEKAKLPIQKAAMAMASSYHPLLRRRSSSSLTACLHCEAEFQKRYRRVQEIISTATSEEAAAAVDASFLASSTTCLKCPPSTRRRIIVCLASHQFDDALRLRLHQKLQKSFAQDYYYYYYNQEEQQHHHASSCFSYNDGPFRTHDVLLLHLDDSRAFGISKRALEKQLAFWGTAGETPPPHPTTLPPHPTTLPPSWQAHALWIWLVLPPLPKEEDGPSSSIPSSSSSTSTLKGRSRITTRHSPRGGEDPTTSHELPRLWSHLTWLLDQVGAEPPPSPLEEAVAAAVDTGAAGAFDHFLTAQALVMEAVQVLLHPKPTWKRKQPRDIVGASSWSLACQLRDDPRAFRRRLKKDVVIQMCYENKVVDVLRAYTAHEHWTREVVKESSYEFLMEWIECMIPFIEKAEEEGGLQWEMNKHGRYKDMEYEIISINSST